MYRVGVYATSIGVVGILLGSSIQTGCSRQPESAGPVVEGAPESDGESEPQGLCVSPHALARLIGILDPWTDDEFSESSCEKALAVAGLFQELDPALVTEALREYERAIFEKTRIAGSVTCEASKAYILMRVIFELPEEPVDGASVFLGGWLGWSSDRPPRLVHADNAAWPLTWSGGRPSYVAGRAAYEGPPYSPAREYTSMMARYAYRDLTITDACLTSVAEAPFVRLIARHEGDFGRDVFPWQFTINASGAAVLTFHPLDRPARAFQLTSGQMERIGHVLSEVDFCGLPEEIGRGVPSGGLRSVELLLDDGRTCRSTLGFPPNITNDERVAASRFLDAWLAVRETFSDDAAFDGREYVLPYKERWKKPLD
jgi:hypothetical protein